MTAEKKKIGIVYLAGAGPGDPELVTKKTYRLLRECDAVVYDNLVPDELVVSLPPTVQTYDVGKQAQKGCSKQEEINNLLVKLAKEGKSVVRLKGSDPLIFGRGGEEAKYLRQHNIPYEIVPGVTSAVAAAAYAGIPCTDRNVASSLLFVTGHKALEKQVSSVSWDWVAQAKQTTIVIYMGVGEIENIVGMLHQHGMKEDIPAAIIERGTYPSQRVIVTTVGELPRKVKQETVTSPALFIIGEAVMLRETLDWFMGKSLMGVRVMVTRPADQAGSIYHKLRELGAEVLPYPTIATREIIDTDAWKAFKASSSPQQWLLFTSENGVRYFFRQLFRHEYDIRTLGNFKIAVIGAGTQEALHKFGLQPDFVPSTATTAALAEEFPRFVQGSSTTVVRVRGNRSVENVDKAITVAGGVFIPMTVYETYYRKWSSNQKDKLLQRPPDVVMFTSGTTVEGLFENMTEQEITTTIASACIISIGPSTSHVIRSYKLPITVEAKQHTIPGMIEELVAYAVNHNLRKTP